jgi:hypothetical protein
MKTVKPEYTPAPDGSSPKLKQQGNASLLSLNLAGSARDNSALESVV